MNRREFLGAGMATAAVSVAGPTNAMTGRRRDAIVIFDTRFEEARRFAASATEQYGLRAFDFAGDATSLWHDRLTDALDQGTAVIGLTAGGARFCLQLLASPGVRCVHHVTHAPTTQAMQHVCWVGGKITDADLHCAPAWPEQAARIAIRQAIVLSCASDMGVSRNYPAFNLPAADRLESWVLAPAAAARRGGTGLLAAWNS